MAKERFIGALLVRGDRPTLVFVLTSRIRTTSIPIDAAILKVLGYVKEFTNGPVLPGVWGYL